MISGSAVARLSQVASFGPWELYEGLSDTGSFMCVVGIEGFVKGSNRAMSFWMSRGSPDLTVTTTAGGIIMAGESPTRVVVRFDSGPTTNLAGTRYGCCRAEAKAPNPTEMIKNLTESTNVTLEAEGFFALTASLDGISEGLAAMKRCAEGETIATPPEQAPLR